MGPSTGGCQISGCHPQYLYGCFLQWWYPQFIHFNRVFHINHPFWGTTIFGNPHIFTIKKSTENVGKIFPGTPWIRFGPSDATKTAMHRQGVVRSVRGKDQWRFLGAWEVFLGGETSKMFYVHPETWVRILSVNHSKHQEPMVNLGGGFEDFFISISTWGDDPIWRAYFSNGLVKPPTSFSLSQWQEAAWFLSVYINEWCTKWWDVIVWMEIPNQYQVYIKYIRIFC